MQNKVLTLALAAALFSGLLMTGCSSPEETRTLYRTSSVEESSPTTIKKKTITVNLNEKNIMLDSGVKQGQYVPIIGWSSDDTNVATLNGNGCLTPVNEGECLIREINEDTLETISEKQFMLRITLKRNHQNKPANRHQAATIISII